MLEPITTLRFRRKPPLHSRRSHHKFAALLAAIAGFTLLGPSVVYGQDSCDGAAQATSQSVSTIDTSYLPVAYANQATRSYADYQGGRPRVWYRYQRRYVPRNYRAYPPRVYYYPPAYRYPVGVYPRTANMMYYGPAARVYYGPWVYAN